MTIQVLPFLRPVLFGSLLLLPAACRNAERSDSVDTITPSQDTTSSQRAPMQAPNVGPSSAGIQEQERERQERVRVTGKDVDPSLYERERQAQDSRERTHVVGKDHAIDGDEELQLGGGGTGGSTGMGGSGGSH
jgi:hypothetical protein